MPKILTILTIALVLPSVMAAQNAMDDNQGPTAAYCFTKAPGSVLSFIPENTRLDMIDYFEAGSDRPSKNSVDEECYITALTPESVSFVASTGLAYQIFVLNRNSGSPIIGVIETIDTPVADSSLTLYDQRWLPLPSLQMSEPALAAWLTDEGKKHKTEVADTLPFMLATYSYDASSGTLTITGNMSEYFTTSDPPAVLQYLRGELKYHWDGKKFKAAT